MSKLEGGSEDLGHTAAESAALYKLAYDAAVDALKQQDVTLANVRNRASGLLATAALVVSFSSGVGLLGTDPGKNYIVSRQYEWLLLGVVVLIGITSSVVLWPIKRWGYGPSADLLVDAIDEEKLQSGQLCRKFARLLWEAQKKNGRKLLFRMRCYQAAVVLLILEVGLLTSALAEK